MNDSAEPRPATSGRGAFLVALGILLSRIVGLVRQRVFAHWFGASAVAGAFVAAVRIPNMLQNLLGEGVLSASFIPEYARLLARGEKDEADRVASAVFGLLAAATALLVAVGVFAAPAIAHLVVGGFEQTDPAIFRKTVHLTRILFPSTGVMVMSAWCLGVLNSHRRFFLAYAAPVVWNAVQIAALVAAGPWMDDVRLADVLAWAVGGGSLLQFGVQLPSVLRLLGRLRPSLDWRRASMRRVLGGFGPVLVSRGVVQISALVDTAYAALISAEVVANLQFAQLLALLPVSLFGMAVSAAELPELARETVLGPEAAGRLRARMESGLRRIAFFVIPSAVAFFALGDVVGGALFQTGRFGAADTRLLWYLLMGSAVGLLAGTQGRLFASAFYALQDTRTPLRFAALRVVVTAALAYVSVREVPGWLGVPAELGCVGITATTGLAAWLEFTLLRRALARRLGSPVRVGGRAMAMLWVCAAVAGAVALGGKLALSQRFGEATAARRFWGGEVFPAPALHPIWVAAILLPLFGAVYLGGAAALGVGEVRGLVRRMRQVR